MTNIVGEKTILRRVELSDIDYLYQIENQSANWGVSDTTAPFSHYLLSRFVESQSSDIFTNRELRLMATTHSGEVCGIVDLFEFDPLNHRAGVGIIIDEDHRRAGYGRDALLTVASYGRDVLQLHQLWCSVSADNSASCALFERCGFQRCGVRREWLWRGDEGYADEILYQMIL